MEMVSAALERVKAKSRKRGKSKRKLKWHMFANRKFVESLSEPRANTPKSVTVADGPAN